MGKKIVRGIVACFLLSAAGARARAQAPPDAVQASAAFDHLMDMVAAREAALVKNLEGLTPIAETYVQNLRIDRELGYVPTFDSYFLEQVSFKQSPSVKSLLRSGGFGEPMFAELTRLFRVQYMPLGFVQMVTPDPRGLDRVHYNFRFVRREFLGDLRCIVIDVEPNLHAGGKGRFQGRIWVEDREDVIVRFNGTFVPKRSGAQYLHFDTWRLNMQPGLWLPAYVYVEKSDLPYGHNKVRLKAQTRFWGYNPSRQRPNEEFTEVLVEAKNEVTDDSAKALEASPLQAERNGERLAEHNVIDRMEKAGLLGPEGEVDKVLTTVVSNLKATNDLDLEPEIRARVLLTTPLESFTVGHTIVISRGLLDVLPDETTLATVLAHEMAHIALGHRFETKYAFGDRMIFPNEEILQHFDFHRSAKEEREADQLALQYLQKSPYRDKLPQAGLFLRQLQARRKALPSLVHAHLGDGMFAGGNLRMKPLATGAPTLEPRNVHQIASLPLGGRIHLDPWNDELLFSKAESPPPHSAKEKMPLELTPLYPYLSRMEGGGTEQAAAARTSGGTAGSAAGAGVVPVAHGDGAEVAAPEPLPTGGVVIPAAAAEEPSDPANPGNAPPSNLSAPNPAPDNSPAQPR
jgi:hypothetical protein